MRLMHVTNVSVLGPAPYQEGGGRAGLYPFTHKRCEQKSCRCRPRPALNCAVCRTAWVEVKAPLFASAAWAAVHNLLLRHMPDDALTGDGHIDGVWCGCECPRRPNPQHGHPPLPIARPRAHASQCSTTPCMAALCRG